MLLVTHLNSTTNSDAIVSFRVSDGALIEKRVLLDSAAEPRIDVRAWDFAGDQLVLWTYNGDLLIYAFK